MVSRPTARDDVLQALADLGGTATPTEIAAASGRPSRSVTEGLAKLRAAGLVTGPKNRPQLTNAGRAAARSLVREPQGPFEEAVEAIFGPSPALGAFCRLAADLIVARRLYPDRAFHPALFAFGALGRGKTAAAELLARALGLGREAILDVPALARGEIFGRRWQVDGGWALEPASHLALPFVCLDELGEADTDVRRQAQILFHGDPVVPVEGTAVRIAGTVMATWNPRDGATVVAKPYFRRALTICVDEVLIPDLPARLRAAELAGTGAGTLSLDSYRPVTDRVGESCIRILERVAHVLTDEGRHRVDLRMLELATLGRAARYGLESGVDLRGLAYFIGTDVLTVTETVVGLVDPDWHVPIDDIAAQLGDVPGLRELAEAARARTESRERIRGEVKVRRQAAIHEDLELTGERARLVTTIDQAVATIKTVPRTERAEAAALRARLSKVRRQASAARSRGALEEIIPVASREVAFARSLRAELDEAKASRDAELARDKRDREAAARDAAAAKREYRRSLEALERQRKAEIRALRRRRAELSKLRARVRAHPGGPPSAVLADVSVLRPMDAREEIAARPTMRDVLRIVRGEPQPRRTRTVVRRRFVDVAGRVWGHEQLAAWDWPAVHAVLDAAIAQLDARLTELEG